MMDQSRKAPLPLTPKAEEITTVEPLLPIARQIVKRKGYQMLDGLELKSGMNVLMVVDSTNDLLVQEAFEIAIQEAGGTLQKIMLHGYPGLKEPVELVDAMFSRNWWPDWVWQAVKEADIVMQGAMLKTPHTPNLPVDTRRGKTTFTDMEWTADLLASNYEAFPLELRDAIGKSAWETYAYAKNIELSDLEGTNLRATLEKDDWAADTKEHGEAGLPYKPAHLMLPISFKKSEGVMVVSSATFGGPIPRMTMTIKGGRVTEVEGGGKFGETMRRSFEEFKDLTSPRSHVTGVNWVSSFGICTHPKGRRSAFLDRYTGSARIHAWAFGHRRSGVIHTSVGEGLVGSSHKIIRHVDQYFTTFVADGKKIIDRGHLLALDDPMVQKVAEKYGDPKELLAEEWIPAIAGVNAT
jgi:hypothetical protein